MQRTMKIKYMFYYKNGSDAPYFDGLSILSLTKVYTSAIEYLNPLSSLSSFRRISESALLCSFTSVVSSSKHALVFTIALKSR